ncbi:MAG: hypothetical protein J2P17_03225 [Mycobacterium sp.]|nr:hypothetical protein [Mycobacterium sp.]
MLGPPTDTDDDDRGWHQGIEDRISVDEHRTDGCDEATAIPSEELIRRSRLKFRLPSLGNTIPLPSYSR